MIEHLPFLELIPAPLAVFLIAMLPVIELRGAIPAGILWGMSTWSALGVAFAGNLLAAFLILYLLDPVTKWLTKHSKLAQRFFDWLFHRTRTKHSQKMSEMGHLALILFVAVPLPGSGAWTGSLVAYLFGVDKKLSLKLVAAGLVIAGAVITAGTEGLVSLLSL